MVANTWELRAAHCFPSIKNAQGLAGRAMNLPIDSPEMCIYYSACAGLLKDRQAAKV
jgi:hypothetical protein